MAKKGSGNAETRGRKAELAPDLSHIAETLRGLAEPIDHLFPDPANSRSHDRANLDSIKGSLRQFGQYTPLVVQADNSVVRVGNGRLAAARELLAEGDLRFARLAVVRKQMDNVTATALSIADNRTAELADWDDAALEKLLREVEVGDEELQKMLANLAEERELIIADDVEDPEEIPPEKVPERFQVLVTCTDEGHQKLLLDELENRGIECRAIVS